MSYSYASLTSKQKADAVRRTQRWRARHPQEAAAGQKRYQALRRERYACDEQYRKTLLDRLRLSTNKKRAQLREEVFTHYGKVCVCCGETEQAFLTLGHVHGDGAKHRKTVDNVYRDIIRRGFPPDFRIECYNCNCGSFRNGGVCPHVTHAAGRLVIETPSPDATNWPLPVASAGTP